MKITKLKWKVVNTAQSGYGCSHVECNKGDWVTSPQADNLEVSSLIASAPEMYGMIETLIGNYQVAASIAENEGYETRYAQDAELVKLLLAKARGEHGN